MKKTNKTEKVSKSLMDQIVNGLYLHVPKKGDDKIIQVDMEAAKKFLSDSQPVVETYHSPLLADDKGQGHPGMLNIFFTIKGPEKEVPLKYWKVIGEKGVVLLMFTIAKGVPHNGLKSYLVTQSFISKKDFDIVELLSKEAAKNEPLKNEVPAKTGQEEDSESEKGGNNG